MSSPITLTTWRIPGDRLVDIRVLSPVAALAVLGLLVVLPLATMLVASLRPAGTLPFDGGALILGNFASVYLAPEMLTMLRNTALYAVVPIVIALPLAFGLAFLSGLAFFLLFIGTPLYGTLLLLVLAFASRFLAYGTRLMHSAQVQIHTELEEAAVAAGVPYLRTFVWINLRLLTLAFLNGWLWVLTHAARDFTTPLMVASASSLLGSNLIFGRYADGKFPESAAMMVVLVVFNVAAVVVGRKWIMRAVGA